jgi:hypothetical protein
MTGGGEGAARGMRLCLNLGGSKGSSWTVEIWMILCSVCPGRPVEAV